MDGCNGDHTRDFLSQPDLYSPADGYDIFSDVAYPFPGSSGVNAPRMGMAALDLNSHGEGWPRMAGYEGLLRSGPQGGGIGGSMGPPPVRVRNGSRTLGLRTMSFELCQLYCVMHFNYNCDVSMFTFY